MEMEQAEQLIENVLNQQSLIKAVISSPLDSERPQKILIRPLSIKENLFYQWTEQKKQQAFHQNHSPEQSKTLLKDCLKGYKQILIFTSEADYQILISKKFQVTILKKQPTKQSQGLWHNRPKEYVIEEGTSVPFLIHLGVMNREGRVYPHKKDKFKQINRFLEMVEDVLVNFKKERIRIIDFGCGKSYLTFALYYFLKIIKKLDITLIGIDIKESVIQSCKDLRDKLGWNHLDFVLSNIHEYQDAEKVDMMVSLHACDTATDAALEKAVQWQSDVILSVPCCQHELYNQVQNESLKPILKHGILKERFAALATDAARAQILEALGYRVQVMEFVEVEHTPKNLLIRAVRDKQASEEAWRVYKEFKEALHIHPALEKSLGNHGFKAFFHQSSEETKEIA